mmetsp:Transcript_46454/g.97207  ORF Transcript_46454/g.97207 Transcript_46454/m.97207 type:complete len:90 (+) Transcript_46454:295-564(+)
MGNSDVKRTKTLGARAFLVFETRICGRIPSTSASSAIKTVLYSRAGGSYFISAAIPRPERSEDDQHHAMDALIIFSAFAQPTYLWKYWR